MLKAKIIVSSTDLTLGGLELLVGVRSGVAGHSVGDLSPLTNRPKDWSCWVMELELDPTKHAGVYGLDLALAALPLELARSLASARESGCEVSLRIGQWLTCDEQEDHGFYLSAASLRWLAEAGADLDLDQYTK